MITALRHLFKLFVFFVLIVTCFTEDSSNNIPSDPPKKPWDDAAKKSLEDHFTEKIYAEFPGEIFYKFVYHKVLSGSVAALKSNTEMYYQETNCKKLDVKTKEDTEACAFSPNGKIIVCLLTEETPVDVTGCKSTGDKFSIPTDDRRSDVTAIAAVLEFNKKNRNLKDGKGLRTTATVTSPMEREVIPGGTKDYIRFSTPESICNKIDPQNETSELRCVLGLPRFDCEATVKEMLTPFGIPGKWSPKREADVKCQENKDPKAIAEMVINDKLVTSSVAYIQKQTIHSFIYKALPIDTTGRGNPTTMSDDAQEVLSKTVEEPGIIQEGVINKQLSPENLFTFTQRMNFYGTDSKKPPVSEIYLKESTCKSANAAQLPNGNTDSCNITATGKVAVCKYSNSLADVSCKYTGDKYEIPVDDRRSYQLVFAAIEQTKAKKENGTTFPVYDTVNMVITSPVQTEVTTSGTRNVVRFSTRKGREVEIPNPDPKSRAPKTKFITEKPRVDCEATVKSQAFGNMKLNHKIGLKCVDSKEPPLPPRTQAEEFVLVIHYRKKYQKYEQQGITLFPAEKKNDGGVTTMSGGEDSTAGDPDKLAQNFEIELNKQLEKEFLFKYTTVSIIISFKNPSGHSKTSTQSFYQETYCKKAENKGIESCKFNPTGKIALCQMSDVKSCKFTGDKYDIDKDDLRAAMTHIIAARSYSAKNYPKNSKVHLKAKNLESPVHREILGNGFQDTFKFIADEVKCESKEQDCAIVKGDIHCEATKTELIWFENQKVQSKTEHDVKCLDHHVTTMSAADDVENESSFDKRIEKRGKEHEDILNKEIAKEFLFKYSTYHYYGLHTSSYRNATFKESSESEVTENIFIETKCKLGETKNTESCEMNYESGKIAVCVFPEFKTCKFPGDKYELSDRIGNGLLTSSVLTNYNKQKFPVNSEIKLRNAVLESPVHREIVPKGLKQVFKFIANETKCEKRFNEEKNMTEFIQPCQILKSGIRCDATTTKMIDLTKPSKWTTEIVVSCPDHKVAPKPGGEDMSAKRRSPGGNKKRRRPENQRPNLMKRQQ